MDVFWLGTKGFVKNSLSTLYLIDIIIFCFSLTLLFLFLCYYFWSSFSVFSPFADVSHPIVESLHKCISVYFKRYRSSLNHLIPKPSGLFPTFLCDQLQNSKKWYERYCNLSHKSSLHPVYTQHTHPISLTGSHIVLKEFCTPMQWPQCGQSKGF